MAGDFVIPAILGKWYPNYSNIRDTISELGTEKSPVKKQASIWLIFLGVLLICFGVGQGIQFTRLVLYNHSFVPLALTQVGVFVNHCSFVT